MSTDAQAPDPSLTVSRRDKTTGGETEEVDIYENEDTLEQSPPDPRPHEVRPLTENRPPAVKRNPFGANAAILGGLYCLILAGIYMRYIFVMLEKQNWLTERDQLHISLNQSDTRNINVTEERDELQTRYKNLNKELEEERKLHLIVKDRYRSLLQCIQNIESTVSEFSQDILLDIVKDKSFCEGLLSKLPLSELFGRKIPI